MSDSEKPPVKHEVMHQAKHVAYICLGSNIDPVKNLRQGIALLRQRTQVIKLSKCWETAAVTSGAARDNPALQWPNFLNLGMGVITSLEPEALKAQVLRSIEHELGRVRGQDKYAPRTIDLDITVFDDQVVDPEIWQRLYLALIFAELLPGLHHPETGETLREAAERLGQGQVAIEHPEVGGV